MTYCCWKPPFRKQNIEPPVVIQPGTLAILKTTIDSNSTFSYDINPSAGGTASTSLITTGATGGTGSIIINNVVPGIYTITEVPQAGWIIISDNPLIVEVTSGNITNANFVNAAVS